MSAITKISNFFSAPFSGVAANNGDKKNLSKTIAPQQLQRLRFDVSMWREAIKEAELAYFPYRVKMQQMFIDTALNGHVIAAMERRKDLTLLRDFHIIQGTKVNEALTAEFKKTWFYNFMSYSIDTLFYGYTLMSIGDITNNQLNDLSIVRRWNVSPDRLNVTAFQYGITGELFNEDPYKNWHIYLKTPSDNGSSKCGFGLLYYAAIYEIYLRNVLSYNGDFVELYSQPYRIGKTNKIEGAERDNLEAALRQMGSNGYAIIDPTDEIQFLETALGGTGWQGYANFEERLEKKISKLFLGHSDALDSIPGKLGSGQGAEMSPVSAAISEKQSKDGRYIEDAVTNNLFLKLRAIGFSIPLDAEFKFINDDETEEFRKKEDNSNLTTATIASTMALGGLQMDPAYFSERTGIPATAAIQPAADKPADKPAQTKKVKAMLNKLYK